MAGDRVVASYSILLYSILPVFYSTLLYSMLASPRLDQPARTRAEVSADGAHKVSSHREDAEPLVVAVDHHHVRAVGVDAAVVGSNPVGSGSGERGA